jgi:hypothetical protein
LSIEALIVIVARVAVSATQLLCEVLRVIAGMAASTDEGANRIGIKAIYLFHGGADFRGDQQFPLGR